MVTDLSGHVPRTVPARFEVIDDRFAGVGGDAHMEVLFSAGRWLEGPVYVPAGRYVLFSDIPNDRVLRWDETTGAVGVFHQPAGYANGRTLDRTGRVVSCRHGHRQVVRTEHDGRDTVLASHHQGRRLNSPNDVVERADGTIWFTDPSYGIDSDYEGHLADSEIGGCHVYRIDVVRRRPDRRRRLRTAERPRLQQRRAPALHRRHPPSTHPALRRRRRRLAVRW